MTVNLTKIPRYTDGELRASSVMISGCGACDEIHIDFKDANGVTFASTTVPFEAAMEIAAKFIEIHDEVAARLGKKVVRQ